MPVDVAVMKERSALVAYREGEASASGGIRNRRRSIGIAATLDMGGSDILGYPPSSKSAAALFHR